MGQTVAAKEGHERLGKRGESFIKGQQGGFAGKGIADQDGNKIDHVVLTKACAGEAHLFLDDFEDSLMGKNLSKGSHFSHPGRSRGLRFRGNLDRDRRMRHTTNVSSLFEKRSLIVFSQGDTFFARAPASLLFSYETSLRIPWAVPIQKTPACCSATLRAASALARLRSRRLSSCIPASAISRVPSRSWPMASGRYVCALPSNR